MPTHGIQRSFTITIRLCLIIILTAQMAAGETVEANLGPLSPELTDSSEISVWMMSMNPVVLSLMAV